MQNHWLRHCESDNLIIFVLGWSCCEASVEHLTDSIPERYDILCLYDYRTLGQQDDLMQSVRHYQNRYLFAWSFGVWVAEQLFSKISFCRAVAFCGSPYPTDKRYGIDPKRLLVTLKGVAKHGEQMFNQKTYGTFYPQIKDRLKPRDTESNVEELAFLYSESSRHYVAGIEWDRCIIGSDDEIFPPENLICYWGIRAQVLPLPHFPFENAQLILRELDIR